MHGPVLARVATLCRRPQRAQRTLLCVSHAVPVPDSQQVEEQASCFGANYLIRFAKLRDWLSIALRVLTKKLYILSFTSARRRFACALASPGTNYVFNDSPSPSTHAIARNQVLKDALSEKLNISLGRAQALVTGRDRPN